MTYLAWLTLFVWVPQIVLLVTNFELLWGYRRTLSWCVFWALVFSIPWDWWAIRTKVWVFPSDTNLGVWIGGLPLEEYLFIIFVTLLVSSLTLVLKGRARVRLLGKSDE
jgi:lycopene cyclase domain-containing protein